jgi:hypothetical protein
MVTVPKTEAPHGRIVTPPLVTLDHDLGPRASPQESAGQGRPQAAYDPRAEADGRQEQEAVRTEIVDASRAARREAECVGQFARSVEVACGDDKPLLVSFGDSYSPVAIENEAALREALGANFEVIFARAVTVKMRAKTSLETLREALGDRYEAFAALVAVEEALVVQPSTMETRARLRPSLTADQNTVLDGVLDQVQYSPKVSAK